LKVAPWDLMTTDDVKAVLPALPEFYRLHGARRARGGRPVTT
jgi:hypothetical protein